MSLLSDIAVPIAKLVNMKKYKEKDFLNPRRDTDFLNKKNINLFKKHYCALHSFEKLFMFATRNHKINIK